MHQKNTIQHHANRAGRLWRATAIGAAFLAAVPAGSPVALAMSDELSLPGLHALQHRDLQRQSGGFTVAGLQINFGFSIETTVNNQFTVVSNFNVSTPGQVSALGTTVAQLTDPTLGSGDSNGGDAMPSAADLIASVNKAIGVSSDESATQAVLSSVAEDIDQKLSTVFSGSGKLELPQDTDVPAAVSAPIPQSVAAEPPTPVPAPVPPVAIVESTPALTGSIPLPSDNLVVQNSAPVPPPSSVKIGSAPAPTVEANTAQVSAPSQVTVANPVPVSVPAPVGAEFSGEPAAVSLPAVAPPTTQANSLPVPTPPVAVASASPGITSLPVAGDTVAPSAPKISVTQSPGISGTGSAGGNASIAVPLNNAQQIVVGDAATTQVIHDMLNGQLAVIKNTLNDVSIQQSVIMNFSVENFTNFRAATQNIRGLSSIPRHITAFSLQR